MSVPEKPITRQEHYLAKMLGQDVPIPEPVTNIEHYLYKLATEGFTGDINDVVTEIVARIVANAPEDFDTLKEISDWISSHEEDASAMNSAILANTQNISDLSQSVTSISVSMPVSIEQSDFDTAHDPNTTYIIFPDGTMNSTRTYGESDE